MEMMKIMLDEGASMPIRAHDTDAGYDLCCKTNSEITEILPNTSAVFDTGVHVEIPKGYAGLLVSKSGLNVVKSITSTGLIDSGFTGSIRAKLYNHGQCAVYINPGDKITQLVLIPITTPALEIVKEFKETDRGDAGFGSTGR